MALSQSMQRVRFSVFEADFHSRELWKHGIRIRIQEQPFKILSVLICRQGEIVTREELRRELWPDEVFVDFDKGLNTAVTKLRESLGDSSSTPRFVETVPRRGYRFLASVEIVKHATEYPLEVRGPLAPAANGSADRTAALKQPVTQVEQGPELASSREMAAGADVVSGETTEAKWWPRFRFWLPIAAALLTAALLFHLLKITRNSQETHRIRTLAVLPLQSFSNDPQQEYFADSMTDELITRLAQTSGLRIISRTSVMRYRLGNRSLPEIAKELRADGIIEGSVVHAGGRIRIIVQLLDASDQHLWAGTFERNDQDILRLQDEVSQQITGQINAALSIQRPASKTSVTQVSPEAYEAYSKGRYLFSQLTPHGVQESGTYFRQAISKAPDYAPAYAGLAETYLALGKIGLMDGSEAYDRA